MRVEHEYVRGGAWAYLAAWDVHRAKVFGRCEDTTGIAPFERLVDQVMSQPPYRDACRMDHGLTDHPPMDHKLRDRLSQFHTQFQHELVPLTEACLGERLTPKLEQLLRIWEMVQIERFVPVGRGWVGRPARERTVLARAFVAKAVLGLPTTVALIERLQVDGCLRRLCGFDGRRKLPGAWLFSRAFAELAERGLVSEAHASLIKAQLGDQLIGHIARDATEIQAREKPAKLQPPVVMPPPRKRGRPHKGDVCPPPVLTRLQRQMQGMSLTAMLADLPRACDLGCKTNSKGFKSSWIGYKLHLDVADGQIPVTQVPQFAA
jgi:hypothetical protein